KSLLSLILTAASLAKIILPLRSPTIIPSSTLLNSAFIRSEIEIKLESEGLLGWPARSEGISIKRILQVAEEYEAHEPMSRFTYGFVESIPFVRVELGF